MALAEVVNMPRFGCTDDPEYSRISRILITHVICIALTPTTLLMLICQNPGLSSLCQLQLYTLLLDVYPAFMTEMDLISEINSCYPH